MEFWPSSKHSDTKKSTKKKHVSHESSSSNGLCYPRLDTGALNSATLRETNQGLGWIFAASTETQNLRLLPKSRPSMIFPPTRPLSLSRPTVTVNERGDQGVQFLRTFYPDVDVPSELTREEVTEEIHKARNLEEFDPYSGNTLVVLHGNDHHPSYLAFPMGETQCSLNLSPFVREKKSKIVFRPQVQSVHVKDRQNIQTFDTPIMQIVTAEKPTTDRPHYHLVVRTQGAIVTLRIDGSGSDGKDDDSTIQVTEVDRLLRQHTDDRPIVDIAVGSLSRTPLFVNNRGKVFRWGVGSPALDVIAYVTEGIENECFWRIAATPHPDNFILASSTFVRAYDTRTSNSHLKLFQTCQPELITSIRPLDGGNNMTNIVTTKEIIWVDNRSPLRPLLAFKHGRQKDRTLQSHIVDTSKLSSFLTSRKNGLITLYDVQRDNLGAICAYDAPNAISPVLPCSDSHDGFVFWSPSRDTSNRILAMQMSSRGSVYCGEYLFADVSTHDVTDIEEFSNFEWSDRLHHIRDIFDSQRQDSGPSGATKSEQFHLDGAFQRIFSSGPNTAADNTEQFYDVLDRIPRIWKEFDHPPDTMLTTHDLILRSGDEPPEFSRSDFFTQTALHSEKGCHALIDGRINNKALSRGSSWSHDITASLNRISPNITGQNSGSTFQRLKSFSLDFGREHADEHRQKELRDMHQLTLDLSLSSHVYSAHTFEKTSQSNTSSDEIETMSLAAEAMTINDEPPYVRFGFLKPMSGVVASDSHAKKHNYDQNGDVPMDMGPLQTSLGVSYLLQDWELGADPESYAYTDPYGVSQSTRPIIERFRRQQDLRPHLSLAAASQPTLPPALQKTAPPRIEKPQPPSMTSLALPTTRDTTCQTYAGSQPLPTMSSSQSQNPVPQTQVLPGLHGGRQLMGNKKPAKKRLEGF